MTWFVPLRGETSNATSQYASELLSSLQLKYLSHLLVDVHLVDFSRNTVNFHNAYLTPVPSAVFESSLGSPRKRFRNN